MEDFFQLKLFNRLSINSVTIYRPNESKIYVFNGNGNNSILAKGGLPYYRTGGARCSQGLHLPDRHVSYLSYGKNTSL